MANPNPTPITSAALIPFANQGVDAPYRSEGVLVTPLTLREGVDIGRAARRSHNHILDSAAIAWEKDRCYVGGRWLCGGGSSGIHVVSRAGLAEFYRPFHERDGEGDFDLNDWLCQRCVETELFGGPRPCVYRVWDSKKQRLLYIGSTKNWMARRGQHRQNTWWWHDNLVVEIEYRLTIEDARDAEVEAIKAEHPTQNVAHNRTVA